MIPRRAIPAALVTLGTTAESQRTPASDTAQYSQLKFRYIGPEGNRSRPSTLPDPPGRFGGIEGSSYS